MPMLPPRRCACGYKIAPRELCPCEQKRKAAADKRRPTAAARGYDSKWQSERAAFLKVHKTCARCGAPATVVDHRIPHRGDRKLFWDRSNWAPLCRPCHDRWKQSTERGRENTGGGSRLPPLAS
nr:MULTISPECIES: HNH endonuclease signature motif containing protein [unclassified Xanthobacter]